MVSGGYIQNQTSVVTTTGKPRRKWCHQCRVFRCRWGQYSWWQLYQHDSYKGSALILTDSTPNFAENNFDNKCSSITVISGKWKVFQDPNYRGRESTVCPRRSYSFDEVHRMLGNDTLSSVKFEGYVWNSKAMFEVLQYMLTMLLSNLSLIWLASYKYFSSAVTLYPCIVKFAKMHCIFASVASRLFPGPLIKRENFPQLHTLTFTQCILEASIRVWGRGTRLGWALTGLLHEYFLLGVLPEGCIEEAEDTRKHMVLPLGPTHSAEFKVHQWN